MKEGRFPVRASMWRMRSARQKEARERDKRCIQWLEEQLAAMCCEVQAWYQWWQQQQQHWQESDHMRASGCDLPLLQIEQQREQQLQQRQETGVIDYSKWDYLPEYFDEGDDEVVEENEPTEEEWGLDFDQDDLDAAYDFSYEGEEDEREEETHEGTDDKEGEEGKEAKGNLDASDQARESTELEAAVFTESGSENKRMLLEQFKRATTAIQKAFVGAAAMHEDPEVLRRIKDAEHESLRQLTEYSAMLEEIADQQIHQVGAQQLSHMIHQTQVQHLAKIEELSKGLGIT